MKTLKLFISSPGDVAQEREIYRRVITRLNREFSGRAFLDGYFWEYEPMEITQDYQEQIPPPSSFDIFVCILWSRLGSRLHSRYQLPDGRPCRSGTEFEFVEAIEGRKRNEGTPDILVWVNKTQPLIPLEPEKDYEQRIEQWRLLKAFLDEWTRDDDEKVFKGAVNSYRSLDKFEELAEIKLRKLVERRLGGDAGDQQRPTVQWHQGSPYRGLQAFDQAHAEVFFGRTAAVESILNAVRRQGEAELGFVLVLGASGSGKSSLVNAGVLPLLTTPGVIEGIGLWRTAMFRPGHHGGDLIAGLAAALLDAQALPDLADPEETDPKRALATKLEAMPEASAESVRLVLNEAARTYQMEQENRLRERASQLEKANRHQDAAAILKRIGDRKPPRARLVLVLDQFEELYTGNASPEQREGFVSIVKALATCSRVVILATLRSDFYHHFQETPGLIALTGEHGKVDVLPPQAHEIGQIIREPARMAGLVFERDPTTGETLDEILRDAALGHPEALPLLEHALDQLYDCQAKRGDRVLRFADYEAIGKLDGALARHADAVFAELESSAQASFDKVFRALVTLGRDDHIPVRRTALRSDWAQDQGAEALVQAFIEQRLFTSDQTPSGEPVVSVAHEALLRAWSRAREWIAANEDFLAIRARVAAACAQWQGSANDPSFLLQAGRQLGEAEEGFVRHPSAFSAEEQAFVTASRNRLADVERRARRRRAMIMASMAILTALAVYGFVDAQRKRASAEQAKLRESAARERAQTTVNSAAGFMSELIGPTRWAERLQQKDLGLLKDFLTNSNDFMSQLSLDVQTAPLVESWSSVRAILTGTLMEQGRLEEAIEVQSAAIGSQIALVEQVPDSPNAHAQLATRWYGAAQLFRNQGDLAKAEKMCRLGLEGLEEAMTRVESDLMRDMWITLQNVLTDVLTQQGNQADADAVFDQTVANVTDWAKAGIGERDWKALLVDTWIARSRAGVAVNDYESSEKALQHADQALEQVSQGPKREALIDRLLDAWAYHEQFKGNPAKASQHYQELLVRLEPTTSNLAERTRLMAALASTLTNDGKLAEATETGEQALALSEELAEIDATNVYNLKPRCDLTMQLAQLKGVAGDWQGAEERWREAYEHAKALLALEPTGHNMAQMLDIARERSVAYAYLNQAGFALMAVENAIAHAESLIALMEAQPQLKYLRLWKNQLAMFQRRLGFCLQHQARPRIEDARTAYQAALHLVDGVEGLEAFRDAVVQDLKKLTSTPPGGIGTP